MLSDFLDKLYNFGRAFDFDHNLQAKMDKEDNLKGQIFE